MSINDCWWCKSNELMMEKSFDRGGRGVVYIQVCWMHGWSTMYSYGQFGSTTNAQLHPGGRVFGDMHDCEANARIPPTVSAWFVEVASKCAQTSDRCSAKRGSGEEQTCKGEKRNQRSDIHMEKLYMLMRSERESSGLHKVWGSARSNKNSS